VAVAADIEAVLFTSRCDGSEPQRKYYRNIGKKMPQNTIVLTLGCGKFRLLEDVEDFGMLPGTELPRLLDMGQCNDAYGALVVAQVPVTDRKLMA
jgi:hydroxylamine reductase